MTIESKTVSGPLLDLLQTKEGEMQLLRPIPLTLGAFVIAITAMDIGSRYSPTANHIMILGMPITLLFGVIVLIVFWLVGRKNRKEADSKE